MAAATFSLGSVPVPHPQPQRRPYSTEAPSPPAPHQLKPIRVSGNPPTCVSAPGRRIVAVGDLHGDIGQTRSALEIAGVLSSDGRDHWVGEETVLIQLGDILDRGEDEIAILSLLRSLDIQAKQKGGAVFQVNGNHETMNVDGDYRFVDPGAYEECADFLDYLGDYGDGWEEALVRWSRESKKREKHINSQSLWNPRSLIKRHKGVTARSFLFQPGGPLACELARHPIALKVNDWLFCHGGLLPQHVAYGIENLNVEVSQWMRGLTKDNGDPKIPFMATRGYDSVVWNRLYSRDTFEMKNKIWQVCSTLEETLQAAGAKAMVVGHTPQTVGINSICSQKIWRTDVGMSSGVFQSMPEVLEISNDEARVLRKQSDWESRLDIMDYL